MRHGGGSHALTREIRIGRVVGWPLLALTLAAGVGGGMIALAMSDPAQLGGSWRWLAIPGCIPVCFALASGRSLVLGVLCGLSSATLAFMTVAAYSLYQFACFIITFMGEC